VKSQRIADLVVLILVCVQAGGNRPIIAEAAPFDAAPGQHALLLSAASLTI
jgi:hypothetical protein